MASIALFHKDRDLGRVKRIWMEEEKEEEEEEEEEEVKETLFMKA
jgi:CO dehydrogenase/acetyl-CoA synthase beta subunit